MLKAIVFIGFFTAELCLAGLASAQTRDIGVHGEMLDRIAAIVNDGLVLKSELDSQIEAVTKRLQEQKVALPSPERAQATGARAPDPAGDPDAARQAIGLNISDEQLNGALQEIAARNKIPFDQLPTALQAQGIDYKQYREAMRKELTLEHAARARRDRAHHRHAARDRAVPGRQDSAAANDEFNVSHILLSLPAAATPQQLDEITRKANDIAARAAKGEDFGQLAIANSNSQTALDGGQLGWRKGNQLPQFILDLVTKMKPGDVSAPVRTPSGFHIVKLNERRSGEAQVIINQIHVRHILMKPNELDDDATVREKLSKLRERILNGEDFAGIASTTSEDPGSAPDGGDLGWSGPGTFVPEFDKAIADLKDNEISEPFKTRYGWHIVQMLGTRTYDSTRRAPAAGLCRHPREQGGRRDRAVAAPAARRSVRRNQDVVYLPRIVITSGEPAGIGPDACVMLAQATSMPTSSSRAMRDLLRSTAARSACRSSRGLRARRQRWAHRAGTCCKVLHVPTGAAGRAGRSIRATRPTSCEMLDRACDGCMNGEFAAMVTAPVQKST
jgi:peptidyl-prolyl cis-trans isomerase SurA